MPCNTLDLVQPLWYQYLSLSTLTIGKEGVGACTNLGVVELLEVHSLPPLDIVQVVFGLWISQAPLQLLHQWQPSSISYACSAKVRWLHVKDVCCCNTTQHHSHCDVHFTMHDTQK